MNNRKMYFKGRLVVASIAVLLALAVTALKRDESRRKAVPGEPGMSAAERSADDIRAVAAVVERVEAALAARDPGHRQARALIDEHRHQPGTPAAAASAKPVSRR